MKKDILFLAHRIPYPPDKGDKIRSWRILQFLASRFDVHLCCFADDKRDLIHQSFLEGICASVSIIPLNPKLARLKSLTALLSGKPLSFVYFDDRRMRKAVDAARERPLAAEFVFSSAMAPYIGDPIAGRPRLVDFCDADSEKWRQYAGNALPPMDLIYAREARLLAKAENAIANWADASFAVSPQEAAMFNGRADVAREVDWFSNGVDIEYFNPSGADFGAAPAADCVFVGAMDYRANVEAVLHFARKTWPLIRKQKKDANFAIVGANPVAEIKALDGKKGIIVTGRVEDVRPWLWPASVVVAPLRVGRGIQNKVLEAMAMGKAVVASPEALTGIDAPAEAAIRCDDPKRSAKEIFELLNDGEKRQATGDAARRFVIEHCDWTRAFQRLQLRLDALGL